MTTTWRVHESRRTFHTVFFSDPHIYIQGTQVALHRATDGTFFIGAAEAWHEQFFAPIFADSFDQAKTLVELLKD